MKPTTTTNRLHFEDLDPHRFEDFGMEFLHRKYQWKRLDPVGAMGADNGIDVFGVTIDGIPCYCQIKRYKSLDPGQIKALIHKIADENELEDNAKLILITACDVSKKGFDSFYEESEVCGFHNPEIYTGKKLEMHLYHDYKDVLEKYFGIGKKKESTKRSLIKKNLAQKSLVEKKLIRDDLDKIPSRDIVFRPELTFVDTALILLSSKASLSNNRYDGEGTWMKVCPYSMDEEGLSVYLMQYGAVMFNTVAKAWRHCGWEDAPRENEIRFETHVKGLIPYYQIVEIEDHDSYFRYSILHCEAEDIRDVFSKISYLHEETQIVFDETVPLNEYEIKELCKFAK